MIRMATNLLSYLIDAPEGAYMHPSSGCWPLDTGCHQTGIFEFQVCATDGEYHTCKDVSWILKR